MMRLRSHDQLTVAVVLLAVFLTAGAGFCLFDTDGATHDATTWDAGVHTRQSSTSRPPTLFTWLDELRNTDLHMSRPSLAMLGGALRVERLSSATSGVGATSTELVLSINYNLLSGGLGRLAGRALARPYVRGCLRRMAGDAALVTHVNVARTSSRIATPDGPAWLEGEVGKAVSERPKL